MKATSHSPFGPPLVTSPEFAYATTFRGTPRSLASARASSTVTPRGSPLAGSRVAQKAEGTGPTPTPTRSVPAGATSFAGLAAQAASRAHTRGQTRAAKSFIRAILPDRILETAALAAVFHWGERA